MATPCWTIPGHVPLIDQSAVLAVIYRARWVDGMKDAQKATDEGILEALRSVLPAEAYNDRIIGAALRRARWATEARGGGIASDASLHLAVLRAAYLVLDGGVA